MASFGSAFVALQRAQVVELIGEVLSGLTGLKAIHSCGNTDWSMVMQTPIDILSLDAYDYGGTLVRHASELNAFLARGGIVAWGIVPASAVAQTETVEGLIARLLRVLDELVEAGVPRDMLTRCGLVTPSCGMGSLSVPLAESILALTGEVAHALRSRFGSPLPAQSEQSEETLATDRRQS